jgi:hypothetical protein
MRSCCCTGVRTSGGGPGWRVTRPRTPGPAAKADGGFLLWDDGGKEPIHLSVYFKKNITHVAVLVDGEHRYALAGAPEATFASLAALVRHYAQGREGRSTPCRLLRPLVFGPTHGARAL